VINYYQPFACEAFEEMTRKFPSVRFFQPSPDKAPWHVQAIFDLGPAEEPIVLNFWPHKNKGQRQPLPAIVGIDEITSLIDAALKDAAEEPFDVFEASEE